RHRVAVTNGGSKTVAPTFWNAFPCGSGLAREEASPGNTKIAGIKKGHPRMAFKKLERFFTYTAATGRM
ncbi:hypothetical protein, partial [Pseudomonas sp. lyk4-TYG-107]|uniref:hypothetical protein n=1 Tax=Pseudomonas sp. lyk4-TYG-107 TaxID=3040317 RepID=UPI002553473F